jgi:hypothetical protein
MSMSSSEKLAAANNGAAHTPPADRRVQRQRRKRPPIGYITVAQLADRAAAAPSTIYAAVNSGRIKACRWRGLTIVADEVAEDFLAVRPLRPADAMGVEHG